MTTNIAFWIIGLIVALFVADQWYDWGGTLIVLQGLLGLIDKLTFWR